MSYQPKTYRKDGGDTSVIANGGKQEVESGGEIEVQSGGVLDIESGGALKLAGVQVTATAEQLNSVSSVITAANKTGGDLDAGTLIYLSGYDTTLGAPTVTVSDATHAATHVLTEDIANDASGFADEEATVTGLDTSGAGAVGDLVYLAAAGGFGYSALTGADNIAQVVGIVVTKHASTGSILFFPGYPRTTAIGTSGLQNDSVTNDKLANITRGSVKVGGASNAPTDLDAKTSGQILVGDGTDIKSVAMSSDATLAANGALTIANDAVNNDKLANIARGSVKVGGTDSAPTDLDAKTSGQILVGDGTDVASVAVSGDATLASTGALTIANDAVNNDKLANIARGSVKVGGASNAPTDLDAKTSGQILVGDGTDISSVAVSGDAALASGGVMTIAPRFADTADGTIPAHRLIEIDGSGDTVVATVDSHTVIGANADNAQKVALEAINVAYQKATLVAASPLKGGHLIKCADNGRATHLVTAGLTGATMETSEVGDAFANQPANDGVTVVSDDAGDTTQTCTIIGTTQGGTVVVTETVALNGTTDANTTKVDWGVILAVKLSASCAGTVEVSETSGGLAITTLTTGVLSKGVNEVATASQGAYNVIPTVTGSDTTTKTVGVKYVNSAAADAYQAVALNNTTAAAFGTAALLVSELYTGDLENTRTCTLKVGAEEDEMHKVGYATADAAVGANFVAILSK